MLSLFHTPLSHNKQNRVNSRFSAANIVLASMLAIFILLMPSAAFAGVTGFKPVKRQSVVYKTTFHEVSNVTNPRLDWRSPSTELTFTIPESAWVEDLELLISGAPMGKIDTNEPILVTFNDAEPITLYPGPYQFDARLKLDRSYIRSRNNTIRFSYKKPSKTACPTPKAGAWDLDFDSSAIVIKARTRMRAIHVSDLKTQLGSETLAPKKVKITAHGTEALKLKALAAQGVGLNMRQVPKFQDRRSGADLEFTIGTRAQLKGKIRDDFALRDTGARIVISEGHPLHVTITGDTDTEVMDMVKAFATYEMPSVRRRKASPGDFYFRTPFAMTRKRVEGKTKLADIGPLNFSDDWGARPQTIRFDVDNPAVSHGKAVIRMVSASSVHPDSFVDITLNGRRLGRTQLDARRKSVAFDIPRGILQGMGNQLTITPDLTPLTVSGDCGFARIIPGFSIGIGSYIDIKSDKYASFTDLSRMAASGYPFGDQAGDGTTVVLNTQSSNDSNAGLRVLTQMALASGAGWTEAAFQSVDSATPQDQDILFLGTDLPQDHPALTAAPRTLKTAITGSSFREPGHIQTAGLTTQAQYNLFSVREGGPARIRGGVAAVYKDSRSGQNIGVLSAMRGQSFERSVDHLLTQDHWNTLEGSVAKWDKDTVLMAQTALPARYYKAGTPRSPKERVIPTNSGFSAPSLGIGEKISGLWFSTQMATARATDKMQNFWASTSDRMTFGKDPEFEEAPVKLASSEETVNTLPKLRGRQTDNPIFVQAKFETKSEQQATSRPTNTIYQPPQLRTNQTAADSKSKPSAMTWISERWQDAKFQMSTTVDRAIYAVGNQSSATFWASIMAVLLIVMSLASPKSRT